MSSKKNYMEVVKCGAKAHINLSQAEAVVTGISIRFGRASYELSYYHNGECKTVWCDESEFTVGDGNKMRIGFK